jgi:hypothetical protein
MLVSDLSQIFILLDFYRLNFYIKIFILLQKRDDQRDLKIDSTIGDFREILILKTFFLFPRRFGRITRLQHASGNSEDCQGGDDDAS